LSLRRPVEDVLVREADVLDPDRDVVLGDDWRQRMVGGTNL